MMPMNVASRPPVRHGRSYRPTGRGHAVAPFFLSATFLMLTAAALEIARTTLGPAFPSFTVWRWPIVHLAAVGGATQIIVGSMTFFAVTLLMTDAPPAWLTRAQLALVNVGALALAGGALLGSTWLGAIGGTAVLGTLGLLLATLRLLRQRSLARPDATLRYYETAIVFLMLGGIFGILMLLGLSDAIVPRTQLRLAHMHLNLVGWITLTIVGTMRFFFATTLGTTTRHTNPLWAEYWPLTIGTGLLVFGWLAGVMPLVGVGSAVQGVGVLAYVVAIVRQWREHAGPLSLPAAHLLAATFWLVVMMVGTPIVAVARLAGAEQVAAWTTAVTTGGFVGFIGQTILGAWVHLFSIVAALPAGPLPPQAEPLRPRLRAILHGQGRLQLVLTNLGTAGLVLGQGTASTAPGLSSVLMPIGLASLAVVLTIVATKAIRVVGLVWTTRRLSPGRLASTA